MGSFGRLWEDLEWGGFGRLWDVSEGRYGLWEALDGFVMLWESLALEGFGKLLKSLQRLWEAVASA